MVRGVEKRDSDLDSDGHDDSKRPTSSFKAPRLRQGFPLSGPDALLPAHSFTASDFDKTPAHTSSSSAHSLRSNCTFAMRASTLFFAVSAILLATPAASSPAFVKRQESTTAVATATATSVVTETTSPSVTETTVSQTTVVSITDSAPSSSEQATTSSEASPPAETSSTDGAQTTETSSAESSASASSSPADSTSMASASSIESSSSSSVAQTTSATSSAVLASDTSAASTVSHTGVPSSLVAPSRITSTRTTAARSTATGDSNGARAMMTIGGGPVLAVAAAFGAAMLVL